jgi:hypothetical protein
VYPAHDEKEEATILAPGAAIEDNPIWILALRH